MSWLTDLIGKITSTNAFQDLKTLNNTVNPASRYRNQMMDTYGSMRDEYRGYTESLKSLLGDSPQIDLSSYINQANQYQSQLGGYSQDMLNSMLRSAGMVENASSKGLSEALSGLSAYKNLYQSLANQGLQGKALMEGEVSAQSRSAIQQLKDIGGLTAGTFAQTLASENQGLRNIAMQDSTIKMQRQQDLANAYATFGQAVQGVYGQQAAGLQAAGGMRSAGYSGAGNMLQAAQQAGLAGAGLAQNQFNVNQMTPWTTRVSVNQNLAAMNNPYQSGLQLFGELYGMDLAQKNAMIQGVSNTITGFQNQASGAMGLMMGMPGLGSSTGSSDNWFSRWSQ